MFPNVGRSSISHHPAEQPHGAKGANEHSLESPSAVVQVMTTWPWQPATAGQHFNPDA